MNEIDFSKLSEKQRHVLGCIAINLDGGHHPKTIESLLKRDLIEEYEEEWPTPLGPMTVKRYVVPLHIHVRWCAWCSDNYKEEDDGL